MGRTHLDILVRESIVHRLVSGAAAFLEEGGLLGSSVKQSFRQLVRLQNQDPENQFRSEQVVRLCRQLRTRLERAAA